MVAVAEDERVVRNAKAWIGASRKRGAADDDVHRAQCQALVQVGFFAQTGSWKHLDVKFAVAAAGIYLAYTIYV